MHTLNSAHPQTLFVFHTRIQIYMYITGKIYDLGNFYNSWALYKL